MPESEASPFDTWFEIQKKSLEAMKAVKDIAVPKRELFAACCLQGLISSQPPNLGDEAGYQRLATLAVGLTDALLAALAPKGSEGEELVGELGVPAVNDSELPTLASLKGAFKKAPAVDSVSTEDDGTPE